MIERGRYSIARIRKIVADLVDGGIVLGRWCSFRNLRQ